ncbi:hypothetical protein [Acidicapsa ligni]|uniref:hypothetical protein n=1 Tax=Acidicapsa ligni TaxID=542300 RepID=UPI0021E05A46|nr:hypothetical protein [Acidicapsa ligni]
MKRVRRISISIEHREISVSMTQTEAMPEVMSGAMPSDFGSGSDTGPTNNTQPSAPCPACNGLSFLSVEEALRQGHIAAVLLQSALANSGVHFQRQPDGQIWICRYSLEQLTGKRE